MSEFERAFALMDAIDEAIAERVEAVPHGDVVVDARLPRVHDRNFLRAKTPEGASAHALADEAESVQGRYAEIRHRRVNLRDEAEIARLEPGFVELGWEPQRFVVMAHRRDADRPARHDVREVDEPTLRAIWAEAIRHEPHGKDEVLVREILAHHRGIGASVPTRYFAAEAGGRIAAYCELYSLAGTGQVENVVTLPEFRWQGLARAVVLHAVGESRGEGNEPTFLVADAGDWPHKLYEKLGFDTVGRYARYLRTL